MAITEVTASLQDDTATLENTTGDTYEGNLTAPDDGGSYAVSVSAYDDAGNMATESTSVDVTIWHTPKTWWTVNDRFNWVDYNRIKNNLQWLYDKAQELWKPFDIVEMGEDITDYSFYWKVRFFNAWEENLEIINRNIFTQDYGEKQIFFENGVFIQWDELNRIEGAILEMRDILDRQEKGLRKLSFRLGTFKEVRI